MTGDYNPPINTTYPLTWYGPWPQPVYQCYCHCHGAPPCWCACRHYYVVTTTTNAIPPPPVFTSGYIAPVTDTPPLPTTVTTTPLPVALWPAAL